MTDQRFKVTPVKHYDGARYLSTYAAPKLPPGEQRQPITWSRLLATVLVVFGLTTGLMACGDDHHHGWFYEWISRSFTDHSDDDLVAGGLAECSPSDLYCSDATTLNTCRDGGWYETSDCNERCREQVGSPEAYSMGCDPGAEDPCQCSYDIIDGDVAACNPGEIYCDDAATLISCDDNGIAQAIDCNARCGADGWGYSRGCDAGAVDPCQCEQDMVAGGLAMCTPEEIYCLDDNTVEACDPNSGGFLVESCGEHCLRTFGPNAVATAATCTPGNANPCGCAVANEE